jgi:carbamoyltransferase
VLEEALLGLARRARGDRGPNLCLAGGVALNALANARLRRESGFSRVFVQPAAGDAGGALGAALLASAQRGDPRPAPCPARRSACRSTRRAPWRSPASSACRSAASTTPRRTRRQMLADGRIVAHARGRCEWGPARARPEVDPRQPARPGGPRARQSFD